MTINANGYKVNNVPEYYTNYEYMVAREVDDAMWFWGCYHDFDDALACAQELGGVVIPLR